MHTTVRGKGKAVQIGADLPLAIIGENINPTRRVKLSAALESGDLAYALRLAEGQVAAGADLLDVNVGVPGLDEAAVMGQVVTLLAGQYDLPLCIDTTHPQTLVAGLRAAPGRPLVNSVNGEEAALSSILPIIKDFNVPVIALTIDDDGISMDPEKRLAVAAKIVERAAKLGIDAADIVIDPLVLAVSVDTQAALVTLRTIELIVKELGTNVVLGASNVSFGLPARETLNEAFLALAMHRGATCAITNPLKLATAIRATDLLLGRDPHALRYLKQYRAVSKKKARPATAPGQ